MQGIPQAREPKSCLRGVSRPRVLDSSRQALVNGQTLKKQRNKDPAINHHNNTKAQQKQHKGQYIQCQQNSKTKCICVYL